MPYRDAFEIKGPGLLYSVAAVQWLAGGALSGIRAADVGVTALGCYLIWQLVRPFGGLVAAVAVGTFFARCSALGFNDAAQPDGWVGIAILGMVLSAARDGKGSFGQGAVRGALLGIAVLFKPVYAVLGLILLADLAWRFSSQRSRVVAVVLGNLVGGLIPVLVALAWLGANGIIPFWLEANIRYTASVYTPGSALFKAKLLLGSLASPSMVLTLFLGLCGVAWTWRRSETRLATLLVAWAVGTLAIVGVQAKYWPYHWLPSVSALAVAAALGAGAVALGFRTWAEARWKVPVPFEAAALLLTATALIGPSAYRSWLTSAQWIGAFGDSEARSRYEQEQFGYYGRGRLSYYRIAETLKSITRSNDPILVWGNQTVLYLLSDRTSATRFGWNWTLVRYPGNEFAERFKAEYLAAVRTAPPAAIVARTPGECQPPLARDAQLECLEQFPALAEFASLNYQILATHGRYGVYARRDLVPKSSSKQATQP